jgi:hypothetical protein
MCESGEYGAASLWDGPRNFCGEKQRNKCNSSYERNKILSEANIVIFELQSKTNYHSIDMPLELMELFRGKPIGNKWKPIEMKFSEALSRRKVGDFPDGCLVPVFSQRAVSALESVLNPNGELLPLQCEGIQLFAFNVTRISDALDERRSKLTRFSSGRILDISRYEFNESKIAADLTIFRLLPEQSSRIYVTSTFVELVAQAGLQGFEFKQLWPNEASVIRGKLLLNSLDELMERDARDDLEDDFDSELWRILCNRITSVESLKTWPVPVRAYYASRLLEWEVGNGGFAQAAMNIPEWFEEAAKGYEVLGKSKCAKLIRDVAVVVNQEVDNIAKASVSIEKAFEYFDESAFDHFDNQLDEVGWWSDEDRVDFVRANRESFNDARKES